MSDPTTLLWWLLAALGGLGLSLLDHFSGSTLVTSAPGQLWIASGLVILAYHTGNGRGGGDS